ncbi:MAG: hypothetical protein GEV10_16150 [Streptosporangiales bacterium]|nr:hypothetical protein [Streptosporangiales bacterium]
MISADGFVVTRELPAGPDEVFVHFTRPELFARWFVVPGFDTPAAKISLDPRPGGAIAGVLVSPENGDEIPFAARYGDIEPDRMVRFLFTDPPEEVTLTLDDLGEGHTRLSYRNVGTGGDHTEAIAGVNGMLDAMETSLKGSAF